MFDHICESTLKWHGAVNWKLDAKQIPTHDVSRKNTAFMRAQQIIDKIAND